MINPLSHVISNERKQSIDSKADYKQTNKMERSIKRLISRMSFRQSPSKLVRSYEMVYPKECKQLRKHPEHITRPIAKA